MDSLTISLSLLWPGWLLKTCCSQAPAPDCSQLGSSFCCPQETESFSFFLFSFFPLFLVPLFLFLPFSFFSFLCKKWAFWTIFLFSMFSPLPAHLGFWIEKKPGKVCFTISFIVLLALASIAEIQEQLTVGIYIATAVPNSFCNRDCINTGYRKWTRSMGFLHEPQGAAHWAGADLGLFPVRRECGRTVSGPVTGLWQRAEPPRAVSHHRQCAFSSCQLLSQTVDIIP